MAEYGSNSDRWPLTYRNWSDTANKNEEFYTISTRQYDDKGVPYSITSVYQDPWGVGDNHRFIGTVDSRHPGQFKSNGKGAVNADADGSQLPTGSLQYTSGTRSQVAYFSSEEGITVIKNKAKLTTLNNIRDAKIAANKKLDERDQRDPAELEREALKETKQILQGLYNAPLISESQINTDGFVLKEKVIATQRDEMAGKPGTHLVYPENHADGDFDFIKIVPIEYVPQFQSGSNISVDWNNVVNLKQRYRRRERPVGSTIYLPMVPGIREDNAVEWGGNKLNPLQMAGANIAQNTLNTVADDGIKQGATALVSQMGDTANTLLNNPKLKDFFISYFAGKAVGANILGRAGIIVNPNLEVLFTGPQLRSFSYNFTFTPRDDSESRVVRTIIKVFKKAMAPKRRASAIFLNVPAVFKIKYLMQGKKEHPFLNKIKPCAMRGFNVDYTPGGSYMTYGDGSMTSYQVSMQFAELEPIYNDDVEVDSPDMGY